ncbi:ATP-dependent DNA helicase PIF1-like protein [Tanacetum coccineum]
MALQYPLLFPYGEDGFHEKIPYHTNEVSQKTNRGFVTMKEFYAYIIQQRNDQGTTLLRGGRLFQQYLVDAFIAVEEKILKWSRNNQDTLRTDLYHNVCDAVTRGDTNAEGLGKRIVLARTFTEEHCKCSTPAQIDDIILAEIPSQLEDPEGYKDNKSSATKGKFKYDNKYMVPHNRYLLLKYQAHINVEWCNESKAIKYLYKYLNKGQDRATIVIEENIKTREGIDVTMFTDWFELNKHDPAARTLAYAEIPKHYVWHEKLKLWKQRKQQKCIGRIVYSSPASAMSEDILHKKRKLFKYPELQLSSEQIQNYCIMEIKELLNRHGQDLSDFSDLPKPNPKLVTNMENRLIREALAFDMNKSKTEHQQLHVLLNPEQRLIYEQVLHSVYNQEGQFYFVYGPGGTGKTFLYKTIMARLWSERMIVLAVASSGIASLLLPGGRTTHNRFVIPLELMENSTCRIKQNTHLAELMQQVHLIIWDEAPMTQKYAFEALDKTLKDILGYKNPQKRNQLFGGLTLLLGGDFRQILPVIPKGKRADIV